MDTTTTTPSLWERAMNDPQLRDLPYKIETNEYGQLVLSPQSYLHGKLQTRIARLLEDTTTKAGFAAVEVDIQTSKGIKAADVTWASKERDAQLPQNETPLPSAPELCVEVVSDSNTEAEMNEKRKLYLEAGAEEVWLCDLEGHMTFFDADGQKDASGLAPEFPKRVKL